MDTSPFVRRANFYETDAMGVIHHSNYIRWMEEARVDFMEKMGYGYHRVEDAGVSFAVIGISCEYKSMVRFGEVVEIFCRITAYSPVRMTVCYEVVDRASGAVRAVGESRHCFVNRAGRPVQLRKVLPELHALFLNCTQTA